MKTKKLKVLAMILLTSTLLILTSAVSITSTKAQTTTTLFLYTTLGTSSVTENGTAMTPGGSTTLISGDTYQFTATPSSGWKFLCFDYAAASGSVGSTNNPYTRVISAACSLEAVFIPTTNTTGTSSGSGASTLVLFASAGGTTSPTGSTSGASVSGTIGHTTTITETPGTGYTFLCWVVQCSSANNYYTSTTLNYTPLTSSVAIEPLWVPTSSGITLALVSPTPTPTKIGEFSSLMVVIVVVALVATAFGTYAYAKRNKK